MSINITPSKENIFKRIRQALIHSTPLPFPHADSAGNFFQPSHQEMEVEFAEQFTKLQGKFMYCLNAQELASQLNNLASTFNWTKIHCREEKWKTLLKENLFDNTSYQDLAT